MRNGWRMCPSICCTTITPASMSSAVTGPWSTSATRIATVPATVAPIIGTKAPRKTSTPSATTNGTSSQKATDHDADGVGERHQHGRPDELRQRDPRHPARGVDPLAGGARGEPHQPGPDALPVGEEEVGREQHDEEAGDDVAQRRADLGDPGDHAVAAGAVGDGALDLLDVAVELGVADVQRAVAQPLPHLVEAGDDRAAEVAGARRHLLADVREEQRHGAEAEHHHDAGRRLRGAARRGAAR